MFGMFKKKRTMKDDNIGQVIAASVSASIMAALADGAFSEEERERLVETVGAYKAGHMSPQEILAMIEMHVSAISKAGRGEWPGLMHQLAAGFSDESKKIVLHAAGNMALVDGKLELSEREFLGNLANWIEVDQALLREWLGEFESTIQDGLANGFLSPDYVRD
ncbi:TerB family tellurite resistance protein [Maricaulis virginensis]|uniref:Co-chaperone DjlA N-terminal domain-containing protein n=1 Tax=Maricaulis virginensis TaxID=144022 RepID=A0A9W6MLG5_9PROT|nr:TerB family tellurite resistance protein [Maricaulis virginensis]GLK50515.1 hypothetical protein GCM10017621_00230 [Maricaulis virginensis]